MISQKKNSIRLIYLLSVLSGFSFFGFLKIDEIPIFQFLLVLTIFIYGYIIDKFDIPKLKGFIYYKYYILVSFIPFLYSLLFYSKGLQTFFYGLFPFLLAIVSFRLIDRNKFVIILKCLNFSMFLVTLIGWFVFFSVIPLDAFFDATSAELDLGYWGIRYMSSTRNSDYLYPLIGMSISLYFFLTTKKYIPLILFMYYNLCLIQSYSRGAIIISCLSLILFFKYTKNKMLLLIFFIVCIIVNFEFIYKAFDNKYSLIIESIFSFGSEYTQFSNAERMNIIYDALISAIQHPFGIGLDSYGVIYENKDNVRVSNSAENAYLTILVERGWFSFAFFIGFVYNVLKKAYSDSALNINKFLMLFLAIYFFLNYELNNVFANFSVYIVLLDYYFTSIKIYKKNEK